MLMIFDIIQNDLFYFFNPSIIPRQITPINFPTAVPKVNRILSPNKYNISEMRLAKKSKVSITVTVKRDVDFKSVNCLERLA